MRRTKRFLPNTIVAGAALVVCLAFGELVVRLGGLASVEPIVRHSQLLWKRRPSSHFINHKEHENRVTINNLGFHDFNRESDSRKRRILLIGDSFVEGLQVPCDQLIGHQLEKLLAKAMAGIEVISAGTSGAGTGYEYVLWHDYLREQLRIDHLILCMYLGNDIEDNDASLAKKYLNNGKGHFSVRIDGTGSPYLDDAPKESRGMVRRTIEFAGRHSALAYLVRERLYLLGKQRRQGADDAANETPRVDSQDGADSLQWATAISATLKLIGRWQSELGRAGIGFSVVLIPTTYNVVHRKGLEVPKRMFVDSLERFARDMGFGVHLMTYAGSDTNRLFYASPTGVGHLTPEGHSETAREIYESLGKQLLGHPREAVQNGTLPSPASIPGG